MLRFAYLCLLAGATSATWNAAFYPNKFILGDVEIYWKKESATIVQVGLRAQTTGWIGFGLGEDNSGSMPGADMLIGKVENGVASVGDYYAVAKSTPIKDTQQHWALVRGEESGGYTTIEARRTIDTTDGQDRPFYFTAGKHNNVLTAVGSSDTFSSHTSAKRWTSKVAFAETNGVVPDPLASVRASCCGAGKTYDRVFIGHGSYTVPTAATTYKETVVDLQNNATFASPVWIVGFETFVSAGAKDRVHHLTLFPAKNNAKLGGGGAKTMYAWVPGGAPIILPSGVGFKFGKNLDWDGLGLQTHFDNPGGVSSQVDTSGVWVYFTATAQTHDADMMVLGDPNVFLATTVPALHVGWSIHNFTCPASETNKFTGEVTLVAQGHHMHATGRQMVTTQFRGGVQIDQWSTNYYDWRFEQLGGLGLNKKIQKGDELKLSCVFKTTSATNWGQGSDDEMCMDFVTYYPKQATMPIGCGVTDNRVTIGGHTVHGAHTTAVLSSITTEFNVLKLTDFGKSGGAATRLDIVWSAAPKSVCVSLLAAFAPLFVLFF